MNPVKKPVIGVIPLWDEQKDSIWMLPGYLDGLREGGGLPVVLPLEPEEEDMDQLYELCDGLLFTGGHDVDPALYGENPFPQCGALCASRDRLEAALFRRAFDEDKPVLGICRGLQLLNVLLGGTLYQDLPSQLPGAMEHHMSPPYDRVCHQVALKEGGRLRALLGIEALGVNSYHHQGVRVLAPCLQTEGVAPDGLVEAASCPDRRFCVAVQWHPEFNYRTEPTSAALFRAFVEACGG